MMLAEGSRQVANLAGFQIDLVDVAIGFVHKRDALPVRRPVGPRSVIAQFFMKRRRVVENVRTLIGLVVPLVDRHRETFRLLQRNVLAESGTEARARFLIHLNLTELSSSCPWVVKSGW